MSDIITDKNIARVTINYTLRKRTQRKCDMIKRNEFMSWMRGIMILSYRLKQKLDSCFTLSRKLKEFSGVTGRGGHSAPETFQQEIFAD